MLLGSYGQTNLGDDLLLSNYLKYFRELGCERLLVSASNVDHIPRSLRDTYPSAEYFEPYRTPWRRLARMVLATDVIVYGGGSVYKELYASTGRERYGVIIRVMLFNLFVRALRRPIYNLNISIGHLVTRRGRLFTRLGLLACRRTLVRDRRSYEFAVQDLRLNSSKVIHSTDGLFLNDEWNTPAPARRAPGADGLVVGVNIVSDVPDWIDRTRYLAAVNGLLSRLLARGDRVVLLPFQLDFSPSNDHAFMLERIPAAIRDRPNCYLRRDIGIDTVTAAFAELDLFVGMRFHSLVLAAATCTPFLGISYDVKCSTFLTENAYPHWVDLESATSDTLIEALDQLSRERAAVARSLRRAIAPLFTQARADLARAVPELAGAA
jgi:polysaccharide pyruvyl transferase WcaK-like protein